MEIAKHKPGALNKVRLPCVLQVFSGRVDFSEKKTWHKDFKVAQN